MVGKTSWSALFGFVGLLGIAGCDKGDTTLAPVEGSVTLDGQPLPKVYLLFDQPQASQNNAFTGLTDEQGRYVLKPLGGDRAGAAPGMYRVTLTTAFAPPGAAEDAPLPPERVPPLYRNGKLDYDVPDGGTKDASFDLKSK
jgi:hypothetical protein